MKIRICTLAALALFAIPMMASAQDADTILAKHLEARGGTEALDAIQTLHMKGNALAMGTELGLDMQYKRPGMFLQTIEVMGQQIKQGTDGSTFWMVNPMASPDPMVVPDEAAAPMMSQADFTGPLVDPVSKGFTATYEGTEDVDGISAYKLVLTHETLPETTYFLNPDTYLTMKSTTEGTNPMTGENGTVETAMSDYREVAGTMFPHSIVMTIDGAPFQTITMSEISANARISNDIFMMPAPMDID